ncbi:MAG: hypothetical protein GEU88_05285 [Solirubrobacterales bacterium]|nr:hypothetical protein [Solirubrobacterales bacterium]
MAEVIVRTSCPVYVHVDPEAGEMLQVVVADEELDHHGAEAIDVIGVEGEKERQEAELRALEVYEDPDLLWPAWRFGH